MSLRIINARVVTMAGPAPRDPLAEIPRGDVLIEHGVITRVEPARPGAPAQLADRVLDARGRVLIPAFVDPHTHACFAGDRLHEWGQKLAGVPYLDILKQGGGIMSTVRAVRAATQAQLAELLARRLARFLDSGTTTLEIKSGYGLSTEHELKMLRAIDDASQTFPGTVVKTALLGHAVDPDVPDFFDRTIRETLPSVHREFPGIAIDAFCEKGAWPIDRCVELFEAARALGHPIRVHADQFTSLGMVPEAVRLGARSVDHLEATTPEDAAHLAASPTFAVVLPCTGLHLSSAKGGPFADARRLLDQGAKVALATNCNPGSSPTHSMPLAIAAAVRCCGMTPPEALASATAVPAALLGFSDRGTIVPGRRADLVLLEHSDPAMLAYELGDNPADVVVCGGEVVRERSR